MLDRFLKQNLTLKKKSGQVIENIKASVQRVIIIKDITLLIEVGDVFEYITVWLKTEFDYY